MCWHLRVCVFPYVWAFACVADDLLKYLSEAVQCFVFCVYLRELPGSGVQTCVREAVQILHFVCIVERACRRVAGLCVSLCESVCVG